MLTELDVAFVDAHPASLSLAIGLERVQAEAIARVAHAELVVELRLLSASHQILASLGNDVLCSETVACLNRHAVGQGELPHTYVQNISGTRYQFRSDTHHFQLDEAFERKLAEEVDAFTHDEDAILGRFAGSPLAVTGIAVTNIDDHGASWRTIHAYPQHRSLVETTGRIVVAKNMERM